MITAINDGGEKVKRSDLWLGTHLDASGMTVVSHPDTATLFTRHMTSSKLSGKEHRLRDSLAVSA